MITSELISALQLAFPLLSGTPISQSGNAGQTDINLQPKVGDGYTTVSCQVNCKTLNANDAVVKLQESNDGINWIDIASATVTLNPGATGSFIIHVTNFTGRYIRANYAHGSVASGTYDVVWMFKP